MLYAHATVIAPELSVVCHDAISDKNAEVSVTASQDEFRELLSVRVLLKNEMESRLIPVCGLAIDGTAFTNQQWPSSNLTHKSSTSN